MWSKGGGRLDGIQVLFLSLCAWFVVECRRGALFSSHKFSVVPAAVVAVTSCGPKSLLEGVNMGCGSSFVVRSGAVFCVRSCISRLLVLVKPFWSTADRWERQFTMSLCFIMDNRAFSFANKAFSYKRQSLSF